MNSIVEERNHLTYIPVLSGPKDNMIKEMAARLKPLADEAASVHGKYSR